MKLDNEIPSRVEDQRNVDIMTKLEWLTQPRVSFRVQHRINLTCAFKKTFKMKVIFFDKRNNYKIKFNCGVVNAR